MTPTLYPHPHIERFEIPALKHASLLRFLLLFDLRGKGKGGGSKNLPTPTKFKRTQGRVLCSIWRLPCSNLSPITPVCEVGVHICFSSSSVSATHPHRRALIWYSWYTRNYGLVLSGSILPDSIPKQRQTHKHSKSFIQGTYRCILV